jgi:hypothetical protein
MRDKDGLQEQVVGFSESFHQEKADRYDIVANMTRQYKDMQDYHIQKNAELDKKIEKLQDETGSLISHSVQFTVTSSSPLDHLSPAVFR